MEEIPDEDNKHSTLGNCTSNSLDGVSQEAEDLEIVVVSEDSNVSTSCPLESFFNPGKLW